MCNDNFQTVLYSLANSLLLNWKQIFKTDHCSNDENFQSSLEAKLSNDKSVKVSFQFDNNLVSEIIPTLEAASEGASERDTSPGSNFDNLTVP